MARPLEFQPEQVSKETPIWTSVYMDRLFWRSFMRDMEVC